MSEPNANWFTPLSSLAGTEKSEKKADVLINKNNKSENWKISRSKEPEKYIERSEALLCLLKGGTYFRN